MTAAPGPRGHWLLGNLLEQRRDPVGMMMRGMAEHGDVVSYRFGPYRALQLNGVREIRHVLVDHAQAYHKWRALRRLGPLMRDGILLAEGARWKQKRRNYQPAFHRGRVQDMTGVMTAATADLVASWERRPDGATVDLGSAFMRLTLDIAARTLLSKDLGSVDPAVSAALELVAEEAGQRILSMNPTRAYWPTPRNIRFLRARRTGDSFVYGVIAERRAAEVQPDDLLATLLLSEAMGDRELHDEIMTILLSGRGTSATGLLWTMLLLDRHPDAQRKVRAELDAVIGERTPSFEDLGRLEYLGRVVQEALRLYPPIWVITRQACERDTVGGVEVAPGTAILISPYVLHHAPQSWEDPERFDPDRFAPERVATRSEYAYLPFGAGPRACIGASFALLEAKVVVSMLLQRFRFTLPADTRVEMHPLITLKPKGGLHMRLRHVAR